jgi:hypothetical protein
MANDGGLIALLEAWMVTVLDALQSGGANVFRNVDVWKHQVKVGGSGAESFTEYQPFAFVAYLEADGVREGGDDLREILEFGVMIGIESVEAGVARIGDDDNLGISKIRDLVIAAFDRKHPGGTLTTDEFYYTGDTKLVDTPKRCSIEMYFECSKMTPVN